MVTRYQTERRAVWEAGMTEPFGFALCAEGAVGARPLQRQIGCRVKTVMMVSSGCSPPAINTSAAMVSRSPAAESCLNRRRQCLIVEQQADQLDIGAKSSSAGVA